MISQKDGFPQHLSCVVMWLSSHPGSVSMPPSYLLSRCPANWDFSVVVTQVTSYGWQVGALGDGETITGRDLCPRVTMRSKDSMLTWTINSKNVTWKIKILFFYFLSHCMLGLFEAVKLYSDTYKCHIKLHHHTVANYLMNSQMVTFLN